MSDHRVTGALQGAPLDGELTHRLSGAVAGVGSSLVAEVRRTPAEVAEGNNRPGPGEDLS